MEAICEAFHVLQALDRVDALCHWNVLIRGHWVPYYSNLPGPGTEHWQKELTAKAMKASPKNPYRDHTEIQTLRYKRIRGTGDAPDPSA